MSEDTIENLLLWAQQKGVNLPDTIEFLQSESGQICCVAKCDEPEFRLQIPSTLVITSALSQAYFGAKARYNTYLKLLFAKLKFDTTPTLVDGEDLKTKFAPYIKALPNVLDSPLTWNPAEFNLLNGTNLFNSLREKLELIFNEWQSLLSELSQDDRFKSTIKPDTCDFSALTMEDVYLNYTSETSSGSNFWFSFQAYLWSHLIFLSRAFPEYIINKDGPSSSIMLLPIIDLLNHDFNSKIEWSQGDKQGSFRLRKLEGVSAGSEIFNNYGGKGNEELLMGYGFVLENNVFDTVALRIKLSPTILASILMENDVALPTLSNYTHFAFETDQSKSSNEHNDHTDGALYLISLENDTCLQQLLALFCRLEAHEGETRHHLRPRLQGLQNLRVALAEKLKSTKSSPLVEFQGTYAINVYRKACAEAYKAGQVQILKSSIDGLKRQEKLLLNLHKKQLVTTKKLSKLDPAFIAQGLAELGDITLSSENDLYVLWLLLRKSCPVESVAESLRWILELYGEFDGDLINYKDEAESLQKAISSNIDYNFNANELAKAMAFIETYSYFRASKEETVLVKPFKT
ncbi:LAMI_0G10198g1_1 [Lachancea mirantina]|uniref:LAMI_0G10198g1_1 n=1 Tax=Lachancea mirantina TaxID=1230905 RepID=A0A1G4KAK5_9SACH|nr:LAMI_0G10198g1_1 [Lachancea mirantina]